MRCPLCGQCFAEKDGVVACNGCPMIRSCHRVKCPRCGYEVPLDSGIVKAIKALRRRFNGARRES